MTIEEFIDSIIVAIDLPTVTSLDLGVPFVDIPDFDSLATLGVMTVMEIELDISIEGEWLWDNKITPQQLFDHANLA